MHGVHAMRPNNAFRKYFSAVGVKVFRVCFASTDQRKLLFVNEINEDVFLLGVNFEEKQRNTQILKTLFLNLKSFERNKKDLRTFWTVRRVAVSFCEVCHTRMRCLCWC